MLPWGWKHAMSYAYTLQEASDTLMPECGVWKGVLVRAAYAGATHPLLPEAACEVLRDVGSSSLTAP